MIKTLFYQQKEKNMDFSFLSQTDFFKNVEPAAIKERLTCLGARAKAFSKGTYIHRAGDIVHTVSLVLSGSVLIENIDYWGNRMLIGRAGPGDLFAEAYACAENEPLLINVLAAEDTEVLMMDLHKVLTVCPHACPQHQMVASNLLRIMAQKNLALYRRMLHTAPKTIRGRVLAYLSFLAAKQKKKTLIVPFDRQEMADYLGVDRSALSAELSKMQKEQLISYHKNKFTLLTENID
jgi:CRP-like cAMP-binding protein